MNRIKATGPHKRTISSVNNPKASSGVHTKCEMQLSYNPSAFCSLLFSPKWRAGFCFLERDPSKHSLSSETSQVIKSSHHLNVPGPPLHGKCYLETEDGQNGFETQSPIPSTLETKNERDRIRQSSGFHLTILQVFLFHLKF